MKKKKKLRASELKKISGGNIHQTSIQTTPDHQIVRGTYDDLDDFKRLVKEGHYTIIPKDAHSPSSGGSWIFETHR